MWGCNTDTSAWRGLTDYQRAFERWQRAPQWRNDEKSDFAPRKVEVNSSERKWSIRMLKGSGAIACRYWNTDVVVFNPDNSITLRPWRSMTTDVFANALMPSGIGVNFNNSKGMLVSCGEEGLRCWKHDRIYDLKGGEITFERHEWPTPEWWPRDPVATTDSIEDPRVNRKRARAACLKHDLKTFERWARTAVMMRLGQNVEWRESLCEEGRRHHDTDRDFVAALDDRAHWIELLQLRRFWPKKDERRVCFGRPMKSYYDRSTYGSGGWIAVEPLTPVEQGDRFVKRLVKALRLAVYTVEKAVDVETIPYYDSWDQVADVAKRKSVFYAAPWVRRGW